MRAPLLSGGERRSPPALAQRNGGEGASAGGEGERAQEEAQGDGQGDDPHYGYLVAAAAAAIFICYADRSNISTAIIPMAKEFGWDKVAEGGILSAFFYGYGATQLLGGRLEDSYGGGKVLLAGVLGWSLATFATPWAAVAGTAPLLLARVGLGAAEGVAFPAIHALIARHVPKERQSTAVATVTSAAYCGAAFALGVTPAIVLHGGWEAAFYTFGAAGLLWVPLWLPVRPKDNPAAPLRIGGEGEGGGEAICVAQFTQSCGSLALLNWLPTYFDESLGVPLADLPAFTVLPYFIQGIVGIGSGVWADRLLQGGERSVRSIRRGFQVVGMVGPAACLLAAAYAGGGGGGTETRVFAAAFFVDMGLALSALTLAGVSVSHLDVAPKHAGLIFATGNTCGTLGGLVGVPACGLILESTGQSWEAVFATISVFYVVGAAVWWAWVGGEPVEADSLGTAGQF